MIEAVALLTSAAALSVSGVALYLASLRPAEIVVDFVPAQSGFRHGGMAGEGLPDRLELVMAVFISNEGARGGVLQGLGAFDVRFEGSEAWNSTGPSTAHPGASKSSAISCPLPYEAGTRTRRF